MFTRNSTWLLLYVDDILIISPSEEDIEITKKTLSSLLDVKDMGYLHHFLGVTFVRHGDLAWLHQSNYINDVLKRFNMENCKAVHTPMCTGLLSKAGIGELVDRRYFQEIVGCLLFISTRTRPDISSAVGILCRSAANPHTAHLIAVKRVLRYLQGTRNFGLKIDAAEMGLTAFADADWGSDRADRKSTGGILLQIGGSSAAWKTGKQSVVALST